MTRHSRGGPARYGRGVTIAPGTLLNQRYLLGDVLGRGGVADVYRATDQVLDREVAVKVLRASAPDPGEEKRFLREARILARLSHPGITSVLDAGVGEHQPFLVMHVIEGSTLGESLGRGGMAPDRVAEVGAQVADALAYAHDAGVVHRDVKPGNVLVERDGQVRLTDFGIARLLDDSTRHTATGMTVGTAAYLSPEQLTGRAITPATDVYSLGLVLIESLTGRRVYDGPVAETGPARVASAPAIPSGVPETWRALLGEMTALDPADRPSAGQVRRRLDELRDVPAAAPTSIAPDPTRLLTRLTTTVSEARTTGARTPGRSRLPKPYLLLALAAVGLVAVVVLIAAIGGPDAPPRTEVPASVPEDLKPALRDLHDAVEGTEP